MWTDGYVSEVEYTHGFYRELSPLVQNLATFAAGYRSSDLAAPGFRYLELGFGQGLSFTINAATNPGSFWGTDFNPVQAANAQALAQASGSGAKVLDASFEELANHPDLPEFDVIALHGIWSWISDANRAVIVDIARRKLRPGGIMYISYNVTPGWSPAMPLRHLMTEYARRQAVGSMDRKVDSAITFAETIAKLNAGYFRAYPDMLQRIERLKGQNRQYLAHEYFNADWHPMPFSQTAGLLADAKLDFATSANLYDQIDAINLSTEAQAALQELTDPIMRQTVRDYLVNQQFRKDIFIKGGRKFAQLEMNRALQSKTFVLLTPPDKVAKKVTGALGEADLQEQIYAPLTSFLASDRYSPKSFAEICASEDCRQMQGNQVWQALLVLCGMGVCSPTHDMKIAKAAVKSARGLNCELYRRAEFSADSTTVAAPLIGSGITLGRFEQMFLNALENGHKAPEQYVSDVLTAQGQRVVIDGTPVETAEAQLTEMQKQYAAFKSERLPILKALMVV